MIEIVLVRHAEPDWEPDGLAVDHPALTERGHAQASRTAEVLGREHFDEVYASPLRRVLETAEPISQALGIKPQVESWLREIALPSRAPLSPTSW